MVCVCVCTISSCVMPGFFPLSSVIFICLHVCFAYYFLSICLPSTCTQSVPHRPSRAPVCHQIDDGGCFHSSTECPMNKSPLERGICWKAGRGKSTLWFDIFDIYIYIYIYICIYICIYTSIHIYIYIYYTHILNMGRSVFQ